MFLSVLVLFIAVGILAVLTMSVCHCCFEVACTAVVFPPQQYYSPMRTTFGLLDPPLGNARLQVAHLVASLLARNSHTVNAELASLGTIQTLWVSLYM